MIPYKDDNPTRTFPYVTITLIVMNIAVYLFFRVQGARAFRAAVVELGLIPAELLHGNLGGSEGLPPLVSFFTAMFMHGGLLHIGGNMLYLWIFGNNVEDYMGHARFVLFYLACGFLASAAHVVFNLDSGVPMVGASGAIAGVLGGYLVLYPWARVHVLVFLFFFITTIMMPAWLVLGFWFVLQVLRGLPTLGMETVGTAYLAHIGGFAAGYAWLRIALIGKKRPGGNRRPTRLYYRK